MQQNINPASEGLKQILHSNNIQNPIVDKIIDLTSNNLEKVNLTNENILIQMLDIANVVTKQVSSDLDVFANNPNNQQDIINVLNKIMVLPLNICTNTNTFTNMNMSTNCGQEDVPE